MWLNNQTGKSYNFSAPTNENDKQINEIPFPIATPAVIDGNTLKHCGNPTIAKVEPTAAVTYTVEVAEGIQPGSMVIVENGGTAAATVNGVTCAAAKITTLLFDGNSFISLGTTDKA